MALVDWAVAAKDVLILQFEQCWPQSSPLDFGIKGALQTFLFPLIPLILFFYYTLLNRIISDAMTYSTACLCDTDDWTFIDATPTTMRCPSLTGSEEFLHDSAELITTTRDSAIDPDYEYGLINALTDLIMREDYDAIEDCKLRFRMMDQYILAQLQAQQEEHDEECVAQNVAREFLLLK